jgi:hypothetical protein
MLNMRLIEFLVIFIVTLFIWDRLLGMEVTDRVFNLVLVSAAVVAITRKDANI